MGCRQLKIRNALLALLVFQATGCQKISAVIPRIERKLLPRPAPTLSVNGGRMEALSGERPQNTAIVWTMIDATEGDKQADSHLLTFPDGTKVMIDTGFTGNRVVPWLKKHQISRLDQVIISHGHRDHYGGLLAIAHAGIRIGKVRFNLPDKALCDSERPWGCDYEDLKATLSEIGKMKTPIEPLKAGEHIYESADHRATLQVLYVYSGAENPAGTEGRINDTSSVLLLTNGKTRALFTGDLNGPLGKYLAEHGENLKAQILKVPHHGTEGCAPNLFFDRVSPLLALVPSPEKLWYSERSRRIRTYFEDHKIPVRVSGLDGNVTVYLEPGAGLQ